MNKKSCKKSVDIPAIIKEQHDFIRKTIQENKNKYRTRQKQEIDTYQTAPSPPYSLKIQSTSKNVIPKTHQKHKSTQFNITPLSSRINTCVKRLMEQKSKIDNKHLKLQEKYLKEEDKICNKDKKLSAREAKEKKENFFKRLEKTQEIAKEKKDAIEKLKQKEEEEYIMKKKSQKKKKKELILQSIGNLYERYNKSKDKINTQKEQLMMQFETELSNSFRPKINDHSIRLVTQNPNHSFLNIYDRLYLEKEIKESRQMALESLYLPTFTPNLDLSKSFILNSTVSYNPTKTISDLNESKDIRVNTTKENKKQQTPIPRKKYITFINLGMTKPKNDMALYKTKSHSKTSSNTEKMFNLYKGFRNNNTLGIKEPSPIISLKSARYTKKNYLTEHKKNEKTIQELKILSLNKTTKPAQYPKSSRAKKHPTIMINDEKIDESDDSKGSC